MPKRHLLRQVSFSLVSIMRKILKKVQIIFAVILLCYNAIFIPKTNVVRADGGATAIAGGLALGGLNPAVWPFIIVGVVACVILGLAYENREELQALGQSVAAELNKMGASIYDFVSGTSVTVNDTLKQAVYNAVDGMGSTIPGYVEGSYFGSGKFSVYGGGVSSGSISLVRIPGFQNNFWLLSPNASLPVSVKEKGDIGFTTLTVTVNIQPVTSSKGLRVNFDFYSGGQIRPDSENIQTDESGNVISITNIYSGHSTKHIKASSGIYLRTNSSIEKYNVTSFSIPELGIGVTAPDIPTNKIRENEYDVKTRERVADVVFGGTVETITFRPDVNLSEVTALSLPTVTDKTYNTDQIRTLEELQAGATSEAGSTATTGALATPGSTTGLLDLSGLWDWLRKIWEAILGIPAALLAGLQAMWQALTKILSDILKAIIGLGEAIGTYILDGLKAMFGVDGAWFTARVEQLKLKFSEKFPSIEPINYTFVDKETVSDLTADFPLYGRQTVVSGAVATEFAKVVKMFLRGLFYILLALFFFKKFHKTAEG